MNKRNVMYRNINIEHVGFGHYCAWVNFVDKQSSQPTAKGLKMIKKYVDLLMAPKCPACDKHGCWYYCKAATQISRVTSD